MHINCLEQSSGGLSCSGSYLKIVSSYIAHIADQGIVASGFDFFSISQSILLDCSTNSKDGGGCYAQGTTILIEKTCFAQCNSYNIGQSCYLIPSGHGTASLVAATMSTRCAFQMYLRGNEWTIDQTNSTNNHLTRSSPSIMLYPEVGATMTHFTASDNSSPEFVACLGYDGKGEVTVRRSNFVSNSLTSPNNHIGIALTGKPTKLDACFIGDMVAPVFYTTSVCTYLVTNCVFSFSKSENVDIGEGCSWDAPTSSIKMVDVFYDASQCAYPTNEISSVLLRQASKIILFIHCIQ